MNNYLQQLKRDYDSNQSPQWYDEYTKATLNKISYEIKLGRLTFNDFRKFVEDNFGSGNFAWGCLQYIKKEI